jgi:hypothetical protein
MSGFVYVITNELYPGHRKIGLTKDLQQRLKSANSTNEFIPETFRKPYVIETAIKVENMLLVERSLHKYFDEFNINKTNTGSQEWFMISKEQVEKIFDFLVDIDVASYCEAEEEKTIRKLKDYFPDGMRIRVISDTNWEGVYSAAHDMIFYNGKEYSMCGFLLSYYLSVNPNRKGKANGWEGTETFINGTWVKSKNLPKLTE